MQEGVIMLENIGKGATRQVAEGIEMVGEQVQKGFQHTKAAVQQVSSIFVRFSLFFYFISPVTMGQKPEIW